MMSKDLIKSKLWKNHVAFSEYIDSLTEKDFLLSPGNKWTAGQHLDHICRSVSPLATGLSFPKFIIQLIFGKANRPSKDYDVLVKKYHSKIESGGKASGRFIPATINPGQKDLLERRLMSSVQKLNKNIDRFSEQQLNEFILPHPLLGKVTLREMLYFTMYHVEHHHKLIISNLQL